MSRKEKHNIYMNLAEEISKLSTCDRAEVGAVIINDDRVISQGFNGAPRGVKHCDEVGHMMHEGHCKRCCHAEENAILFAASRQDLKESSMYVTHEPCIDCLKMSCQVGLKEIRFKNEYDSDELFEEKQEIIRQSNLSRMIQQD